MKYKFYFYNNECKDGDIDLLNLSIEEVNMQTDSDALLYAKDYVIDINETDDIDTQTDEEIKDYLDDIDTDNCKTFCVAIVNDKDEFIYGDNYTLTSISNDEEDDALTEAINSEDVEELK